MHSETEYRPIEFPFSQSLQNLDQSVAFRATTLFTIGWRSVHTFLLMRMKIFKWIESVMYSNDDYCLLS